MENLIDENMDNTNKDTLQFHWWILLIWAFFFLVGHLFRIMHWPFATMLTLLGAGGFIGYSLASLILTKRKAPFLIICNVLGLAWILAVLWGVFFNRGNPLNITGLFIQLIVLTVLFVIQYIILRLIKRSRRRV